jgi:hypothetical protein
MIELVAALAIAPWSQPARFRPLPGWRNGASGTLASSYGPVPGVSSPEETTAWIAKGVRYRDPATADPPNATLSHLPRHGVVVFVTAFESAGNKGKPVSLQFDRARRYPCCDGTAVPGGEYELSGAGPGAAYSVIVRVYFGSAPTASMRAEAQQALDRLELPAPR